MTTGIMSRRLIEKDKEGNETVHSLSILFLPSDYLQRPLTMLEQETIVTSSYRIEPFIKESPSIIYTDKRIHIEPNSENNWKIRFK